MNANKLDGREERTLEQSQELPKGYQGSSMAINFANYLASTEEALPLMGLSKSYGGKSKSFRDLAEVRDVEDLWKREHIINRKRALKLKLRRLNVKQKFPKSTMLINQEEEIEGEVKFLKRSFSLDDLLS